MRKVVNLETGEILELEDAPIVERPIEELEAERVQAIKAKAGQIILAKYPEYKQTNAQLGIYGEEYLVAMKAFIADIVKQSNELEADKTKTSEDFKGELND